MEFGDRVKISPAPPHNYKPMPTIGRASFKMPLLARETRKIPWQLQYFHLNWKRLKAAILERDGHKCRACFTNKRILHVHHRKYYGPYIWSVEPKDLITLCSVCHDKEHRKKRPTKSRLLPQIKLHQK
jgi:5-methylcytosine-specific restriction endonuclease McrA